MDNKNYYEYEESFSSVAYAEEENRGVPFGVVLDIHPKRDYSILFDEDSLSDEFGCVWVSEALFETWLPRTYGLDTFDKSLKNPSNGIPRFGVTILPPDTVLELIKIIIDGRSVYTEEEEKQTDELLDMLGAVYRNRGYAICFGEN
jgi:hypothetical protein